MARMGVRASSRMPLGDGWTLKSFLTLTISCHAEAHDSDHGSGSGTAPSFLANLARWVCQSA